MTTKTKKKTMPKTTKVAAPKIGVATTTIRFPVLRRSGSILSTFGEDKETGWFYAGKSTKVATREKPTRAQAKTAVGILRRAVLSFPFENDVSDSRALAAILTPIARHAIPGPVPMMVVDASAHAMGKSLLVEAIGRIVAGERMSMFSHPDNDIDAVSRVNAVVMGSDGLTCIDSVQKRLGSPALEQAMTADEIIVHAHGVPLRYPQKTTWFASGVNISFTAEMRKRVLRICLAPHPDVSKNDRVIIAELDRSYVEDHEKELRAAAFTILRAYMFAGRPSMNLSMKGIGHGAFREWADLVCGALVWAGAVDPTAK